MHPSVTATAEPNTLRGHTGSVRSVAVLGENRAVSASDDETLRVWDVDSGETLRTLRGHTGGVNSVAVLGDNRVVSASDDKTLCVWDVESGKTLRMLRGHTSLVNSVAVLGDSRVVSASLDRALRVWDVESGETLRTLEGHTNCVYSVAVLGDNHVVSASGDQTLRVWDIESGWAVAVFTLEAAVRSVVFVPGPRVVVAGDAAGGVHFLDFVEIQPKEKSEMGDLEIDGYVHGATTMTGNMVVHQAVPSSKEPAPSQVDAVLITAITREREAALAELRAQDLDPVLTQHGGRYHQAFELERGDEETLRCLLAQPSEKGPHATQALMSDLLRTFEPALVVMVGVAGGLDERGVGEGDVVVARRIYNYEPGRLQAGGLVERPEPYRASARLIDLANALDADGAFVGVLGGRCLHVRDYASGEKVLMDRDSELRRRILELSPDVYAFEMEGHGLLHSVWEAAREVHVQCGLVKSVSDFGDASMREGKDERQRQAARRAVGVALELLRRF